MFVLVFQAIHMDPSDLWDCNDEAVAGQVFHRICLVWFSFLFKVVGEHLMISHGGDCFISERNLGFLF